MVNLILDVVVSDTILQFAAGLFKADYIGSTIELVKGTTIVTDTATTISNFGVDMTTANHDITLDKGIVEPISTTEDLTVILKFQEPLQAFNNGVTSNLLLPTSQTRFNNSNTNNYIQVYKADGTAYLPDGAKITSFSTDANYHYVNIGESLLSTVTTLTTLDVTLSSAPINTPAAPAALTLANANVTDYSEVVSSGAGNEVNGSGVLAILGGGVIDFTATTEAVDRRDQGDFVYRNCDTNAVVLQFAADELNTLLDSDATWNDTTDSWVDDTTTSGSGNVETNASSDDIHLKIPFTEIQSHYVNNTLDGTAHYTAVNDTYLSSYFVDFAQEMRDDVLINGGEVLFDDEVMSSGQLYEDDDLAATIRYAGAALNTNNLNSSGVDVLNDPTFVEKGSTDSLKILEVNKMLRKMMDYGYNGRAATGSGDITGSGVDGLIDDAPFRAGDVFFFPDGFSIQASVVVVNELHENHGQLLDAPSTLSNGSVIATSGTDVKYTKRAHTSNLFIVLV